MRAAQGIADEAVAFAVQHLGAHQLQPRIRLLPEDIGKRNGIRGFWDGEKSTAYVGLSHGKDVLERTIVTAHEAGHPVHSQLWPATSEYKAIGDKLKQERQRAEEAAHAFFHMFAQSKGLPVSLSEIRENDQVFGMGLDEYVGVVDAATYKQGFYLLVNWARKAGCMHVLRQSVKAKSTEEVIEMSGVPYRLR